MKDILTRITEDEINLIIAGQLTKAIMRYQVRTHCSVSDALSMVRDVRNELMKLGRLK